jgi:hypothetical protein
MQDYKILRKSESGIPLKVYVNPQMGTNSVWEWGVPKWEFLNLPAHFHMGTPRMETGTVVLAGH